ncbi:MAG: DUF1653 domain-containing protein [Roseburia sp.]|nr:DUF1653 domain-containing protein [Roseburia sp.]
MNRNRPKPFERYRHFKGKDYQVLCMAKDADTGEDVVVYQALYGDYVIYTRPMSQFLSETDHEKYPDAAQKYRFQEISMTGSGESANDLRQQAKTQRTLQQALPKSGMQQTSVLRESVRQTSAPQDKEQSSGKLEIAEPRPGEADPALLAFLDADTMEEKSNVLVSIRHRITNRLIDDFAVTLDVVIPEGSIDVRYQQLLSSIRMVQKYEIERQR